MELEERSGALVITRLPVEQMGSLSMGLALTDQEGTVLRALLEVKKVQPRIKNLDLFPLQEGTVLRALLEGKKVQVLDSGLEYKDYRRCAPLDIYQKFMALERGLREMGICVVRDRHR